MTISMIQKTFIHKPYESSVARARGQAAEKEKGDQPRWSGPNLEWGLGEKRKWRVATKIYHCVYVNDIYIYIISIYIYILYLKKLYESDVTIYHIAWTIFPWTWNFEDYFFADMLMDDHVWNKTNWSAHTKVLQRMVENYIPYKKPVYQKATRYESLLYCIDPTCSLTFWEWYSFVGLILLLMNPGLPLEGDKMSSIPKLCPVCAESNTFFVSSVLGDQVTWYHFSMRLVASLNGF